MARNRLYNRRRNRKRNGEITNEAIPNNKK